jgi:hypothetical protein
MSTTAVSVGPAPAAYPEPREPIPPVDNTALLYGATAAIIIAIAIVGALLFFALRKRP